MIGSHPNSHTVHNALAFLTLSRATLKCHSHHYVVPAHYLHFINLSNVTFGTYDHRVWKTGLPVRSAVLKPHAGELVVGWVTTSESSLLYVFSYVLFLIR